jgi:hypothetical protein
VSLFVLLVALALAVIVAIVFVIKGSRSDG